MGPFTLTSSRGLQSSGEGRIVLSCYVARLAKLNRVNSASELGSRVSPSV